MPRGDPGLSDRTPRQVLVPQAPVLVAGFREVLWLDPNGEIEALAPAEARSRVERETPMLCHGPATARRLDTPGFPALDLLELFAFAHPARFCVPTPRGLPCASVTWAVGFLEPDRFSFWGTLLGFP